MSNKVLDKWEPQRCKTQMTLQMKYLRQSDRCKGKQEEPSKVVGANTGHRRCNQVWMCNKQQRISGLLLTIYQLESPSSIECFMLSNMEQIQSDPNIDKNFEIIFKVYNFIIILKVFDLKTTIFH